MAQREKKKFHAGSPISATHSDLQRKRCTKKKKKEEEEEEDEEEEDDDDDEEEKERQFGRGRQQLDGK